MMTTQRHHSQFARGIKKWEKSKAILRSALIWLSGSSLSQQWLQRVTLSCQGLMGIGSGGTASTSGEKAAIQLLKTKYRPPYCIFDVGANAGQFLNLLRNMISSKQIQVHCFEPSSESFRRLRENSAKESRVKLNNIALGAEKTQRLLHYDKKGSELASLTRRQLDHFGIEFNESETVFVDTLDHYCLENQVERIHLLKLDVEGHELDVLNGSATMFSLNSIDIITFEFGGCDIDTRIFFRDFFKFFTGHRMDVFRITPTGYLYRIGTYKEIYEQFRTTNFLATRSAFE
jgi:FkbM family methyltransferase